MESGEDGRLNAQETPSRMLSRQPSTTAGRARRAVLLISRREYIERRFEKMVLMLHEGRVVIYWGDDALRKSGDRSDGFSRNLESECFPVRTESPSVEPPSSSVRFGKPVAGLGVSVGVERSLWSESKI